MDEKSKLYKWRTDQSFLMCDGGEFDCEKNIKKLF